MHGGGYKLKQKLSIHTLLPSDFQFKNQFSLVRPHFSLYVPESDAFVLPLSWGNAVLLLQQKHGVFTVADLFFPDINKDSYLKFISAFDGLLWIAAREQLVGLAIKNRKLSVQKRVSMPERFRDGINYITKIKETYYMTCWGAGEIYQFDSLDALSHGTVTQCNDRFGLSGTPYFITSFDDRFYITDIVEHQGVYEFTCDERGRLQTISPLFSFGAPNESDTARKCINPVLR